MIANGNPPRFRKMLLLSILLLAACVIGFSACAQVPKESVELSATVGRDIAQVYQSHKEIAKLLYERIKKDVNRFVDNVYAPYQIKRQLKDDYNDFKSGNQDSLFAVLNKAVDHPDDSQAQLDSLVYMEIFLEVVRGDIESFRREQLSPVIKQEQALLSAIDRSYNQIHYANSIVTGHLASIVKVHDAQEQVLNEFNIEGLREDIGKSLAETSRQISKYTDQAEKIDEKLEERAERNRKAFMGQYKDELNALIGLSKEDIDKVTPGTTDLEIYAQLISVVTEASADNIGQAELKNRIMALGEVAVEIAKRVPALIDLLT
jgi:hypothetical protein